MDAPNRNDGQVRHWLLRPRWTVIVGMLCASIIWAVWPVRHYEGHFPFFIATTRPESRHFLGTVSPRFFPDPWKAHLEFDAVGISSEIPESVFGDESKWAGDHLFFRTANILWEINPADEFKGLKRGEPGWKTEIEKVARTACADLNAGRLERADLIRTCRVWLWARNRWPEWKKKLETWLK